MAQLETNGSRRTDTRNQFSQFGLFCTSIRRISIDDLSTRPRKSRLIARDCSRQTEAVLYQTPRTFRTMVQACWTEKELHQPNRPERAVQRHPCCLYNCSLHTCSCLKGLEQHCCCRCRSSGRPSPAIPKMGSGSVQVTGPATLLQRLLFFFLFFFSTNMPGFCRHLHPTKQNRFQVKSHNCWNGFIQG